MNAAERTYQHLMEKPFTLSADGACSNTAREQRDRAGKCETSTKRPESDEKRQRHRRKKALLKRTIRTLTYSRDQRRDRIGPDAGL